MHEYILYRQGDKRWGSVPYPSYSKKYTIKSSGCGPTSVAMLVSDLNKSITPKEVASWLSERGYASKGTNWSGIVNSLKHYGYTDVKQYSSKSVYKKKNTDAEKLWHNHMQTHEYVAILNMGDSSANKPIWTTSGHYITITNARNIDGVKEYYVQDPGGRHNDGWFKWSCFEGYVRNFWTVKIPSEHIAIDGNWGERTTRALQDIYETYKDGVVSSQPKKYRKYLPACSEKTFKFVVKSKGSQLIKSMQKEVGTKQDGKFGPTTIKAWQKKLKVKQDGICGLVTVKALQTWINKNIGVIK